MAMFAITINKSMTMSYRQKLNMKKLGTFALAVCIASGTLLAGKDVHAQSPTPQMQQQQKVKTDFSDDQLEAFVSADKKLAPIQQKSQQQMMKTIKGQGLTVQRFNEIAREKQQGKKGDASVKESVAFNKAAQKVLKQKKETNSEMEDIIQKEGLEVQTFQQIAFAYQRSPKVQKKIKALMQTKQ